MKGITCRLRSNKHYAATVEESIKDDRIQLVLNTSSRLSKAAGNVFDPVFHRAMQPLKRKSLSNVLLFKNKDGGQTNSKSEQGMAVKEYLAVEGRGIMRSFEEHINVTRSKEKRPFPMELDAKAVVGALDLRIKSFKVPMRKAMRPIGVPADIYAFAGAELARIWDPIVVETTLSFDVPIKFQGGDSAVL